MKKILKEGHRDLVGMIVRARILIEDTKDPTVLDIMTDMRALPGIVTIRQTQPVSDPNFEEKRLIELDVSYNPYYLKDGNLKDDPVYVAKLLKTVEGVDMVKITYHDDRTFNARLKNEPVII